MTWLRAYSVRCEYLAESDEKAKEMRDTLAGLHQWLEVDQPAPVADPDPGPEADYGTQPPEVPA